MDGDMPLNRDKANICPGSRVHCSGGSFRYRFGCDNCGHRDLDEAGERVGRGEGEGRGGRQERAPGHEAREDVELVVKSLAVAEQEDVIAVAEEAVARRISCGVRRGFIESASIVRYVHSHLLSYLVCF